jgi:FdhD protein
VGALVFARALPASGRTLVVSGRASFEIIQKAAVAGIPIVASVSAPSSLAIDLAARMNVTLVAFLRGETMSVYTVPERVVIAVAGG